MADIKIRMKPELQLLYNTYGDYNLNTLPYPDEDAENWQTTCTHVLC